MDCESCNGLKTSEPEEEDMPEKAEKVSESDEPAKAMLNRISHSDAFFKSQQKNEPDLEVSEKLEICSMLLQKCPLLFLSRYSKYLIAEDLAYFRRMECNYEVNFHLAEAEKRLKAGSLRKKIRNRRFEALKTLATGDYFSDSEMRQRNPLLYEQMVGRFLTDDERQEIAKETDQW